MRYPEIVRFLGERRFALRQIESIRCSFPKAKVSDEVEVVGYKAGLLELGQRSCVNKGTILAFGDETSGFGRISIGAGSWIGQYNNLRACSNGDIRIGTNCLVSQYCTLLGGNHRTARDSQIFDQGLDQYKLGVALGDDVWLGAGVVVTPGNTISRGAVIGANAVVTHDVPEYEIWAGVPAHKIGERR